MPTAPKAPSSKKAQVAKQRPRDSRGYFIKLDPNRPNHPNHPKHNVVNVVENTTQDDQTLIDVKVTNPLRKITEILSQIKKKQATVIDFKFTIPLVALPIFMLLAFSLGRAENQTCSGNIQTKIGLLYTLKTTNSSETIGIFDRTKAVVTNTFPFLNSFVQTKQKTANRTILIQRDNIPFTILNPKSLDLTTYHSRQVFATGDVNTCENTISVENTDDVQLVP